MRHTWPPIIRASRLSRWIRLRDIVLTLLVWGLLMAAVHAPLEAVWHRVAILLQAQGTQPVPPPVFDRALLRPYLVILGIWVAVVAALAWRNRALLRAQPRGDIWMHPLPREKHAAHFSIEEPLLSSLWENRRIAVKIDTNGHMTCVQSSNDRKDPIPP